MVVQGICVVLQQKSPDTIYRGKVIWSATREYCVELYRGALLPGSTVLSCMEEHCYQGVLY